LETVQKSYRIERKEISFLRFVLEAYDGMAQMRTIDAAEGIVALHIAPGCEHDLEMLLADLEETIWMEAISPERI
jgi:Domain of unknown function (DUF4911)